jgi:transcription antitermination factor NusG
MIRDWHIAVTKSRFEKKCESILILNGFETFLPTQKVLTQWSDRKKWIEKPLFPGYIFIKYHDSERFKVLYTEGIAKIVQFEKKDYFIHENLINGIKDELNNQKKIVLISPNDLKLGDEVTITSGPFIGLNGKYSKIDGKERVVIEIEAVQQCLVLEIDKIDLIKTI